MRVEKGYMIIKDGKAYGINSDRYCAWLDIESEGALFLPEWTPETIGLPVEILPEKHHFRKHLLGVKFTEVEKITQVNIIVKD